MKPLNRILFIATGAILLGHVANAEDFFLTIGGGYAPSGNQASLENNVLFYQRLIEQKSLANQPHAVFFADGSAPGKDLQVMDRAAVPKAHRLMAEFFGSQSNLGLTYRNHRVPNVKAATKPLGIRLWLEETSGKMKRGDRLWIYVTSHGKASTDRSNKYNTSISLWNNSAIHVSDFVAMLDKLPDEIEVIAVMVQCHAGGFARFVYNDGDSEKGLSKQRRIGFFATVYDRQAAGCTPEVNEADYVEYSTYFWAAVAGRDRLGQKVALPDYNKDGKVSLAEAHAYTILTADTIDLPIKTSGEFLNVHSGFRDRNHPELLSDTTDYSKVLELASPTQKAVLDGLSAQLGLAGEDRLEAAYRRSRNRGRSRNGRGMPVPGLQLRRKIASDLKRRWPELANVLNPLSVELITLRSEDFIHRLESHPDYKRYRKQVDTAKEQPDEKKIRVKYERFLRVADNVVLAENLKLLNQPDRLSQFEVIKAAEEKSFPGM